MCLAEVDRLLQLLEFVREQRLQLVQSLLVLLVLGGQLLEPGEHLFPFLLGDLIGFEVVVFMISHEEIAALARLGVFHDRHQRLQLAQDFMRVCDSFAGVRQM